MKSPDVEPSTATDGNTPVELPPLKNRRQRRAEQAKARRKR